MPQFAQYGGNFQVFPTKTGCVCFNDNSGTCYALCVNLCVPSSCTSSGCQKCNDQYYLDTGSQTCVQKPCYQVCPQCTTSSQCKVCSDCTQGTNLKRKICSITFSLVSSGCLLCQQNYYLNPEGFCTSCTVNTDPSRYKSGQADGTGLCRPCSEKFSDCAICNDNYASLTKCIQCLPNKYFHEDGSCGSCDPLTEFTNGIDDGSGKCSKKPCYQNCPNCKTMTECAVCVDCNQCSNSTCKTCTNKSLETFGCLPHQASYYLNSEGFCENCSYI